MLSNKIKKISKENMNSGHLIKSPSLSRLTRQTIDSYHEIKITL